MTTETISALQPWLATVDRSQGPSTAHPHGQQHRDGHKDDDADDVPDRAIHHQSMRLSSAEDKIGVPPVQLHSSACPNGGSPREGRHLVIHVSDVAFSVYLSDRTGKAMKAAERPATTYGP